ncbi:tetratricopeptide repeat protein [Chloroflexota bacterium]
MNSLISRRTALLSLLIFSSLLIVAPSIYQAAKINVWSLHYLQGIYRGERQAPAPEHPRGEIWQALSSLSAQEWHAAIDLLSPLAVQGNKYGIELLGRAFEGAGDYSAAFQAYRHIANIQGLLRVAATASQVDDVITEREAYYAAWEINPRNVAGNLAKLLAKQGDFTGAEEVLRQSLDRLHYDRIRPYWLVRLAEILESQNKWTEAVEIHEQVIEDSYLFYPGERHLARRYADLAWAYLQSDQIDKAVSAIQKSLSEIDPDPRYAEYVWLRAGEVYEAAGMVEQAQQAFRRVLELKPNNRTALDAIQRLSNE